MFLVGAVALRSAGCIINDLADKSLDAQVERTKSRPLAANTLTSIQAFIALFIFLIVGAVIWWYLNESAKYISVIAACMMVIYPFMKRITHWPQLFLGFTFNIGLLIAIAHTSTLTFSWAFLSLFLSFVLWTIFYDTIYAFADIDDDLKANARSTAIVMRHAPKAWLTLVNVLIHVLLFLAFGLKGSIPILIGGIYLQTLLKIWNPNNPTDSIRIFSLCHFWGLVEWTWFLSIGILSP